MPLSKMIGIALLLLGVGLICYGAYGMANWPPQSSGAPNGNSCGLLLMGVMAIVGATSIAEHE